MTQDKQTENMTQDKQTENMTQDKTNREYDTRQNKQRI